MPRWKKVIIIIIKGNAGELFDLNLNAQYDAVSRIVL